MRKIKFKARKNEGNREWVHGYLYESEAPLHCFPVKEEPSTWYILQTSFADWNMPRGVDMYQVDPGTVGQFVMIDMNERDIYEGDRCNLYLPASQSGDIEAETVEVVVTWKNNEWYLEGFNSLTGTYYFGNITSEMLEVTGNIHD